MSHSSSSGHIYSLQFLYRLDIHKVHQHRILYVVVRQLKNKGSFKEPHHLIGDILEGLYI